MPLFRKNPIHNQWVIIATERAKRPRDYKTEKQSLAADFCPFCPGNEASTPPAIRTFHANAPSSNQKHWKVRVVPNKFPALRVEGSLEKRAHGLYDTMQGIGAHEVIIESNNHLADFADLSTANIKLVFSAWKERIIDLKNDARFQSVMVFKNQGALAGATLEHVHSQLIALPMIPHKLQEELHTAQQYFDFKQRCLFCDILDQEIDSQERIIFQNERVVALAPFGSRFPFEVLFLPRRHEPWYEAENESTFDDLAEALQVVLKKLNIALDQPAFNLMLHSAPFHHASAETYHWHLELIPKLNIIAGFERGSGLYINPIPSETAAQHLRTIDIR